MRGGSRSKREGGAGTQPGRGEGRQPHTHTQAVHTQLMVSIHHSSVRTREVPDAGRLPSFHTAAGPGPPVQASFRTRCLLVVGARTTQWPAR